MDSKTNAGEFQYKKFRPTAGAEQMQEARPMCSVSRSAMQDAKFKKASDAKVKKATKSGSVKDAHKKKAVENK